jgi:uncharacterized protein YbaR (Trm112 family)
VFFELTDLLTCPRCGPGHGLILLVQEVEERRVRSGWLGCPGCRHDYPVLDGLADLRLESEQTAVTAQPVREDELALKILALTGLAEERAYLLLDERIAHAALEIVEMAPDLEVITVRESAGESETERHGISRVLAREPFPLAEYRLRGVAVAPGGDAALVRAAARRLAVGGRLALFDATPEDVREVERSGLRIVAAEGTTAVAERSGGSLPVLG